MADFQVVFMDAGQGDCTLIIYPDGSLTLIDCGSTKSGDQAFAQIWVVLKPLIKANKGKIDNLVLTHADEDHYNKLRALATNMGGALNVSHVYYGGDINLYKNSREQNFTYDFLNGHPDAGAPPNSFNVEADPKLSRQGVAVYVLSSNSTGDPTRRNGKDKNTNSIVLMVEVPGVSRLYLMGDAFVETEQHIMTAFATLEAQNKKKRKQAPPDPLASGSAEMLLKMGHHGSDTSTGADWVKRLSPNLLVVSSGTKTFGRKGMPTIEHMNATIAASKLNTKTGIEQSYVVFDPSKARGANFLKQGPSDSGVWSTCYEATWVSADGLWQESGQSWYYGVANAGSNTPKKKKPVRWYGYTGYEEDEDEDEEDES